jgi:hypothetical protein
MRNCGESQLIGWRVAPHENYARGFSKGARGPLGVQDHKFGRLCRYLESERLHNCGSGTWVDDSKVQFSVLCRNRNTISIPLRRFEGCFRSQPGLAAMRSSRDMGFPPSARYAALANVAEFEFRHCQASIVYQRGLNWTFELSAVLGQRWDGGERLKRAGLGRQIRGGESGATCKPDPLLPLLAARRRRQAPQQ